MKNLIIFGLFIMALILVQYTRAQSVDDILKKNLEAMGGADKLATLKTVKMDGTMNVQGNEIGISSTKSHMKGMRLDIDVMGTNNYQVANMKKGSVFMPIRGMSAPEEMDADQIKLFQTQYDIQSPFLDYKTKGTSIESLGTEEIAGNPAYKLKLTFSNGRQANYFIDTKTNRVVKSSGKTMVNGQEMEMESSYEDYKQNADGYWFPYTVKTMQGTISYDKILTNIPVEDTVFDN